MLKRIDEVAVAQFIAFKNKPQTAEERRARADLKEQKAALLEALTAKCRYLQPRKIPPIDPENIATLYLLLLADMSRGCCDQIPMLTTGHVSRHVRGLDY